MIQKYEPAAVADLDEQDLQDLIFRVIEGLAPDHERDRLQRALAGDPELQRRYTQMMWLHSVVVHPAGRRLREAADHVS